MGRPSKPLFFLPPLLLLEEEEEEIHIWRLPRGEEAHSADPPSPTSEEEEEDGGQQNQEGQRGIPHWEGGGKRHYGHPSQCQRDLYSLSLSLFFQKKNIPCGWNKEGSPIIVATEGKEIKNSHRRSRHEEFFFNAKCLKSKLLLAFCCYSRIRSSGKKDI